MTDTLNRLNAIALLNRAGLPAETRQIIDTAAIVTLVERDVACWLAQQLTGSVSRTLVLSRLRDGQYRGAANGLDGEIAS